MHSCKLKYSGTSLLRPSSGLGQSDRNGEVIVLAGLRRHDSENDGFLPKNIQNVFLLYSNSFVCLLSIKVHLYDNDIPLNSIFDGHLQEIIFCNEKDFKNSEQIYS